jgi:hypothetical protein
MAPNMNNHNFVFICGLHRSGTSILFRVLRDHPAISGFEGTSSPEEEGMHLQTVFKPSGFYGGAGKFGFDQRAHLTELSDLVTSKNRGKLFNQWSHYWDLDTPYLMEKSPPNIIRTRFLQQMFPNTYFIVIMRHPIAVTYATRAWYRNYRIFWRSYDRILKHWLRCHQILRNDSQFINNIMVIKYETLVKDPATGIKEITDFLGIEQHLVKQKILPKINEKYFSMWRKDRHTPIIRHLRQRNIAKYESQIRQFGYSLVDLSHVEPFFPYYVAGNG